MNHENSKRTVPAKLAAYYCVNPRMVSSPFGGVEGVDRGLLEEVFARLGVGFEGRRVLDVGCGRGFVGEVVEGLGGTYFGVDLVRSRGGFRLALADGARLPFGDGTFDALLCIDVFEHMPDLTAAAREMRRVLRPGGSLFLSAPNYGNVAGMVKKVCEGLGLYTKDTWAPFGRWQPQELEQCMTARRVWRVFRGAGFRAARRMGYGAEVGLGLFPWLDHPKMPEALRFRLQRLGAAVGPAVARVCPGASLHNFWKLDG